MKFKRVKHINSPGCAHELTFSCFHKQDFFTDERLCIWFLENLDSCRKCGMLKLLAYVIMPDHVHLLIFPGNDNYNISKILGSIKIPLTRKILSNRYDFNNLLIKMRTETSSKAVYRFWQRGGGYDRNINSKEALFASINYMHFNPVRKGLVTSPLDWKWSSARFYEGCEDYILKMDKEVLTLFF